MAKVEAWYEQDLKRPVRINYLDGSFFNQDAAGSRIGVKVYSDGQAVTLAGSITGYCVQADGTTVPISGTRSGNTAYIDIPQSALSVPGPLTVTIKNTESSVITTLCAVVGIVTQSRTGVQVDPGQTVTDWTNQISAQLQACQDAADNVGAIVAVPYANLTFPVEVNTYTTYNGNLYCCTTRIATSESFTAAHWRQTNVCSEISDLKSALDFDNDYLNHALKDIDETMDILYREGYGKISLTENTIIIGISLKSGVTYSITVSSVETPTGACYFNLYDSNNTKIVNNYIDATTPTKTVTYTPNADKNDCYFTIAVTTAGAAGTHIKAVIQNTNGENKFEQLDNKIDVVNAELTNVENALITAWPAKNILPVLFQDSSASGIEWIVNDDGTITAKGTASGLAYKQASIVLPVGTYILNGCPNGSTTNGYRMAGFLQGNNATNITDANPEMEFVSDGTTKFNVQLIVPNGTSITSGITFKPMIRNKAVYPYDDSYLPYKMPNVVNHEAEYFGNAYGYKNYADIAWPSLTYNGIVWTNNGDGTIKATGKATGHAGISAAVTLPAGNYAITGAPPGSTAVGYEIGIAYGGGSAHYVNDLFPEYKFTLSDETSVSVYLMMPNNTDVGETGVVFKPLIRNTDIYPYDDTFCSPKTIYMPDTVGNISYRARSPWFLKKMNVIGDSIVQGVQNQAFANETAKELNLGVLRNYGIGGCCIAVTDYASQYAPVVSRWDEMDNDADIVFVHAGTNDYSQQVPLGDADSLDPSTFNGALNVIMNGLRVKYPTALVIFDSILSRYNDNSTSESLPITTDEYRQAIEDRCKDHKFVFYDCYKYSGFDFVKDNNQSSGVYHVLSFDGLHPNAVGAKILGRKIAGFINWQ